MIDSRPTDDRPTGRPTRAAVDPVGVHQRYSRFLRSYGIDPQTRQAVHLAELLDADRPAALLAGSPDEEAERELRESMEAARHLLAGGVVGRSQMRLLEYVAFLYIAPLFALGWSVVEAAELVVRSREVTDYAPATLRKDYYQALKKIEADAAA